MNANSKEVYCSQLDLLENRMHYANTDGNLITEINNREIAFDLDDIYDPSDKLAELYWLAGLIEEPSLGNVTNPPVSSCFGAESRDLNGVGQISKELRNSSSISGNIPTCILNMTAPSKKRSIRAGVPFSNWGTRILPLVHSNPVMQNCPNNSLSVNAAVSNYSDFLICELAKSQSSNRLSETDRGIEEKRVIKCMHCGAQKTPQWRAGQMGLGTLCNACGVAYKNGKPEPEYRPELIAVDKMLRKCIQCGIQKTPQWRFGPMGPGTLCNACGMKYRKGKLLPEYRPKVIKCMKCGGQNPVKTRCNSCKYRKLVPEYGPSACSTVLIDKHSEEKRQKEFISQPSEAKQTSSGSEVLENCPNSYILANTTECSGSDYSVSKQRKSDSKQGFMREGQDAMDARKCVDCGNQKNPEWRAGKMDSMTPCNTFGVKYKSGKNSPEYSLVASTKFSFDKDSYSCKLLLEGKAQKELVYQGKQTHLDFELQDSYAEPPQNGLENQPKYVLSNDTSKQVKKFENRIQGTIRKMHKATKVRKCMHCSIKKTPQWRDGPMGPKTLCNACGVRYKRGKLLPEYRPAASPTFSASKHSNSHKKVMEIRSQKELTAQPS